MPGVPSGRGCEACRKQKKKCDQVKPACGRCTRLEIACVGCGQRRFKFVDETQLVAVKPASGSILPAGRPVTFQSISWAPSNEATMIMSRFCSALGIKDARYDLGVYGGFMRDIPRRLGTNPALDASVRATTSVFHAVQSRTQTVESLEDYGKALAVLGTTLNNPVEASTANTLCAMYLMMVCQGWVGQSDDLTGHGAAFAYILNRVDTKSIQDEFEDELLVTLCVPVIIESIGNPKIQLNPWLERITEARDKVNPFESLKLSNLAKISDFINSPGTNLVQMRFIYQSMGEEMLKVRRFLAKILEQDVPDRGMHSRYQTIYSIQLTLALILNIQLRSFSIDDFLDLVAESKTLITEAILLAEDAAQYRPLGASGIPLCLVCAWAGTNEASSRMRIEEILAEYQHDFVITRWMDMAVWIEQKLKNGCLSQCFTELSSLGAELEMPPGADTKCCVM